MRPQRWIVDCAGARRVGALSAALTIAVGLAACATRPDIAALTPVVAPPQAPTVKIFVATNRAKLAPDAIAFAAERSPELNFAQFTISIPPNHEPSTVKWPRGAAADPETAFATTDRAVLGAKTFLDEVNRAAKTRRGAVVVFVHGFNTSFEEALFRMAQVHYDGRLPNVPVLFSWPSKAQLTAYAADRESAAQSRDALEGLLRDLQKLPNVREIVLASHSMGGWLAVEALRQTRARGASLAKLRDVILAAPDIGVDEFRTQVTAIGPLRRPITVLSARDDLALAFSRRLHGVGRVGLAPTDDHALPGEARRYGVRIIDVTASPSDGLINHDRFIRASPVLAQFAASGWQGAGASMAGVYIYDPAQETLNPK